VPDSRGRSARSIAPQLGHLFSRGSLTGASESQLLEAFIGRNDEEAFRAIVARHGPMVLGVCRQLLHDPDEIEDAFQATFIVLVRRAASLRRRERLGNWLYGVAYRVARRSRSLSARRKSAISRDSDADPSTLPAPIADKPDFDTFETLHQAIRRLPDRYRLPIVLCYFEGLSHEAAALELGWPLGSVKGRLSRARDLLRKRLVRRGIALSTAVSLARLDGKAFAGLVPASLQIKVIRSVLPLAGTSVPFVTGTLSVSTAATTLAQGVIRTMIVSQIRALTISLLVGVGLVSTGVTVIAFQGPGTPRNSPKPELTKKSSEPQVPPRPEHSQIEAVRRRLDLPVSMDFPNETPLEDVLKYIQAATSDEDPEEVAHPIPVPKKAQSERKTVPTKRVGGLKIYVDPAGLQDAERTMQSPVTIKLDGVPLRTTLRLVLEQLGLAYDVQAGFILISSQQRLSDLKEEREHEQAEQRLADRIVEAERNPSTNQILEKLELPISMDFENETPIEDIIKYIQSATSDPEYAGIPIYHDPRGFQDAEKTLQSPVTIVLEKVSLKSTLKIILKQLGLAYCVHDGFLMISTPVRIHEELETARVELGLPPMEPAKKP
jgi:RNA polymerase sigma factor (sigma-70 family)